MYSRWFSGQVAVSLHSATACQVQLSVFPCEIGVLFEYRAAVGKGCVELLLLCICVFNFEFIGLPVLSVLGRSLIKMQTEQISLYSAFCADFV